ncbi:MAG TPA: hypothetical protein VEG64_10120 [Candidatus Sulfotelmatobacter sp.]|nr:hypothetical protein [Candidatus Sulfotelmatobacter sp.]
MVVTHSGLEIQRAARTPTVGHRVPARENFSGAYGVGAHAEIEKAAERLTNVETIESVKCLIAGRACDMHLAEGGAVRQNGGQEGQGVADVARRGIRELNNFLARQFLGCRALGRVNRRRGIIYVNGFLIFLLVGKSDLDGFCLSHLHRGVQLGVEAFFFDRDRGRAGS